MKRSIILLLLVAFVVSSCSKVPITKRRQFNLIPAPTMNTMSLQAYNDFLNTNKVVPSGSDATMVKRVGGKIAAAATSYLKSKKQLKRIKDFKWEFNLVDDETANAWCMPGGKVVFYTGILPITKTEAGLATVMGHEVAHAIARHGNERMTQAVAVQAGGIGLSVLLQSKPTEALNLFAQAYGIGSQLGMLKFSRTHESEADKMGLIFMSIAGYNPREATEFWTRMKTMSGGEAPPEFVSTHPSHETRIKDLNDFMPNALKYYGGNK